eukprot:1471029-Amphidinium_carterae.1
MTLVEQEHDESEVSKIAIPNSMHLDRASICKVISVFVHLTQCNPTKRYRTVGTMPHASPVDALVGSKRTHDCALSGMSAYMI